MEALGIVGALFTLVGLLLAILIPFFVYGTNVRTKETALALKETNKLLAEIMDRMPARRLE